MRRCADAMHKAHVHTASGCSLQSCKLALLPCHAALRDPPPRRTLQTSDTTEDTSLPSDMYSIRSSRMLACAAGVPLFRVSCTVVPFARLGAMLFAGSTLPLSGGSVYAHQKRMRLRPRKHGPSWRELHGVSKTCWLTAEIPRAWAICCPNGLSNFVVGSLNVITRESLRAERPLCPEHAQ